MNRPLGFLSPVGILVALLVLIAMSVFTVMAGPRLFSPGALNAKVSAQALGGVTSHAALVSQCSACHSAPWSSQTMADLCLACHQDVAAQLSAGAGLHGGLMAGKGTKTCHGCHTEHKGAAATLTVLDAATFPHDLTGYSLQGHRRTPQGAGVACADCHTQDLAHFDQAVCATCHSRLDAGFMQTHLATFGPQCRPCHDGVDRYGRGFDHNKLSFPLAGKHASVACAGCHANATTVEALQKTPTDCVACHQKDDAHQGQFGTACASCHTPNDWKQATFDHSKSAFPLTGAHVKVQCGQCHTNNVFKGTPTDCAACHQKDDAHQGQFGTACGGCHTPDDWKKATFDHSKSAFPLTGAHVNLKCEQCHKNNVFKGTPADCASCHAEPAFHAGAFGSQGQQCATCHTTTGWSPAQFTLAHQGFPLNHGERQAAGDCKTCHPTTVKEYTCYGCHAHSQAQIASRHAREGISGADLANCVRCHAGGRGGGD